MTERVSVLITCYNYGRFLGECLDSVLSQSRKPDEIVVVDDGSTDDTAQVAKSFPQARYVWQKNAGYSAATNRAFQESTGDILCHLDADDYWLAGKLERVLEVFERFPEIDGVLHHTVDVDSAGAELATRPKAGGPEREAEIFTLTNSLGSGFLYPLPQLHGHLSGSPTTITVRRRAITDLLPMPEGPAFAVDGVLLVGASRAGVYCLPDTLAAYRHHGENLWADNPAADIQLIRMWRYLLDHPAVRSRITKRHADLWEAVIQERIAYITSRTGEAKLAGVFAALHVPCLALKHGMFCNWKHLVLPAMCVFPIRRAKRPNVPTKAAPALPVTGDDRTSLGPV